MTWLYIHIHYSCIHSTLTLHVNELWLVFHQGYTKDNNKENRSTSTTISSPRSTLRRQAKANNNLLLPRCVWLFFCLSVRHSSWFSPTVFLILTSRFFVGMYFPPIWYVDFTTQRDDPSAKNSWTPPCYGWPQRFNSCPTARPVANISEPSPR